MRPSPPGDISHSSRHAITGSKPPPPRDAARGRCGAQRATFQAAFLTEYHTSRRRFIDTRRYFVAGRLAERPADSWELRERHTPGACASLNAVTRVAFAILQLHMIESQFNVIPFSTTRLKAVGGYPWRGSAERYIYTSVMCANIY